MGETMTAQGSERCEHETDYGWKGITSAASKKEYLTCPFCPQPEAPKAPEEDRNNEMSKEVSAFKKEWNESAKAQPEESNNLQRKLDIYRLALSKHYTEDQIQIMEKSQGISPAQPEGSRVESEAAKMFHKALVYKKAFDCCHYPHDEQHDAYICTESRKSWVKEIIGLYFGKLLKTLEAERSKFTELEALIKNNQGNLEQERKGWTKTVLNLEAKLAEAVEALEFYAEADEDDGGKLAKKFLSGLGRKEK